MNTLDRKLYKKKLRIENKYKDIKISFVLGIMVVVCYLISRYIVSLFFKVEIFNQIFIALLVLPVFFNAITFFYYSRLKIKIKKLIFCLSLFLAASFWFSFFIEKIIKIESFIFFKHPVISIAFITFLFLLIVGIIVIIIRDKKDEEKYLKKKYNRES